MDTKEDDPSVPVIAIVLAAAAVCCCPIILALLLRARGKTTFVLTFDGAKSYDLAPEEVAELQAQAIKVVVAHSRRGANGGQQEDLEAVDEAQQKPCIEEDDVHESHVLNENKEAVVGQGADALGPEDQVQEVLVGVSFRSTVSSDGLEMTFKNLLSAAAAGRGDGCGVDDEPATAQAAGLPVTIAVGSKSLTLVLASKGQPLKKKRLTKALPQGAAEVVAFENPAFAGPDDGKAAVEAEAEASDGGYLHVDATAPTADDTPNETAAALAAPAAPTSGPAVPAAEDTEESGFGFGAAACGDSAEIDAEIEAADDGAGFTF